MCGLAMVFWNPKMDDKVLSFVCFSPTSILSCFFLAVFQPGAFRNGVVEQLL